MSTLNNKLSFEEKINKYRTHRAKQILAKRKLLRNAKQNSRSIDIPGIIPPKLNNKKDLIRFANEIVDKADEFIQSTTTPYSTAGRSCYSLSLINLAEAAQNQPVAERG